MLFDMTGGKPTSKNETAAQVVGMRAEKWPDGAVAIDFPCELGYHCPVCQYDNLTNGEYDTRLAWSEYNGFLWCQKCDRDYPSCLCLPHDPAQATDVYLKSVRDAVERVSLSPAAVPETGSDGG